MRDRDESWQRETREQASRERLPLHPTSIPIPTPPPDPISALHLPRLSPSSIATLPLYLPTRSRRCVPSQSGLIFERPQPHNITRFRVSNGFPSARSIGMLPVTQ